MPREEYNRRCIDGSIHGCGVCKGYCTFSGHPGYLTEKQMLTHDCLDKGCHYFIRKPRRERPQKTVDMSSKIVLAAQEMVMHLEGLKVLRAEQTEANTWTVYYVAIAGYALQDIVEAMRREHGVTVCFSKLNYSFDTALQIIMQ